MKPLEVIIIGHDRLGPVLTKAGAETEAFAGKTKAMGASLFRVGTKLLAAGGIVYGLDKFAQAGLSAQAQTAKLDQALKNAHLSLKALKPEIDAAESSGRKLGFTNESTRGSIAALVTATGDYTKSHKYLADAQDLARFKSIDLSTATRTITGTLAGNTRALRQLGIIIMPVTTNMDALKRAHIDTSTAAGKHAEMMAKLADKHLTAASAMRILEERIHGQAKAFAGTAAGALAQFNAQLSHVAEEVGLKLLPPLTRLLHWLLESTTAHQIYNGALRLMKLWWDGIVTTLTPVIHLLEKVAHWLGEHKKLAIALGIALGVLFAPLVVSIPIVIGFITTEWDKVKKFFHALWISIRDGFNLLWDALKYSAVQAAYDIVEPFSHLPGFMGHWARVAKNTLKDELASLKGDMQRNAAEMANAWGEVFYTSMGDWAQKTGAEINGILGTVLAKTVAMGAAGAPAGGVAKTALWASKQPNASSVNFFLPGEASPHDCSAFTQAVFAKNGISIGRDTYAQYGGGTPVNKADLQPGDLVFFNYPGERSPGHVGIYVGGGYMVHDRGRHGGVMETPVDWAHYVGARRYSKGGTKTTGPSPNAPAFDPTGLPTKPGKKKGKGSVSLNDILPTSFQAAMAQAQTRAHRLGESPEGLLGEITADTSALKFLQRELENTKNAAKRAAIEKEIAKITGAIEGLRNKLKASAKAAGDKDVVEFLGVTGKVGGQFGLAGQFVELNMLNDKLGGLQSQLAKTKTAFDRAKINEEIKKIKTAAASLTDSLMITVMVNKLQSGIDKSLQAFDSATGATIRGMQADLQSLIASLDAQLQSGLAAIDARRAQLTPAEKELRALQDQLNEDQASRTIQQAQDALTQAMAAGDTTQIQAAQQNLADVMLQERMRQLEKQATIERAAQDSAATQETEALTKRFDALKKDAQDRESLAETSYSNIRAIARTTYEEQLNDQAALELGAELQDKNQYGAWVHLLNEMAKSWNRYRTWLAGNQGITAIGPNDNPDFGGADFGGGHRASASSRTAIAQAAGGDWLVRQPTLFLAGEAGAERATFQPLGGTDAAVGRGGEPDLHIHFDGPVFGDFDQVAKQLAEPIRREFYRTMARNRTLNFT